jgi:hypothetical protein
MSTFGALSTNALAYMRKKQDIYFHQIQLWENYFDFSDNFGLCRCIKLFEQDTIHELLFNFLSALGIIGFFLSNWLFFIAQRYAGALHACFVLINAFIQEIYF